MKLGARLGLKAVTIGIIIAYLAFSLLAGGDGFASFFWIFDFDYTLNLLIGVLAFYGCGYVIGQRAGYEIILKHNHAVLTGIKYGLVTLLMAAVLGSLLGFFQEGLSLDAPVTESMFNYIAKPVIWIVLAGFIPASIVGTLFGIYIKQMGRKHL